MTSSTPLEPDAAPRIKLTRRQITVAVGLATILIFGSVLYFAFIRNNAADVGDCLADAGVNRLQQVDCGSSDAKFRVVGRVSEKSQAEATFSTCGLFQETTDIYWEESVVLCLGPAAK